VVDSVGGRVCAEQLIWGGGMKREVKKFQVPCSHHGGEVSGISGGPPGEANSDHWG